MIWRRQLPVASPISALALVRAVFDSARGAAHLEARARDRVEQEFRSRRAVLTDSGTSALVLALRLAVPAGGAVGFPGYACVDLSAAARFAGVRVRLYDIDPATLSPDLDSVERMLRRGVDAIVVAHLFGYPSDVPSVHELASRHGVAVIEDAAQGAGGSLHEKRLGGLGELGVVSFGRGKGICASGGGALLAGAERWGADLARLELSAPERGFSSLATGAIQWALGRPSVYALPSMLPWLHLGEMVYHPASEPRAMSIASSALVASAFGLEGPDLETRRVHARVLDSAARDAAELEPITPIAGATPGYLRYAVRDLGGRRVARPALGVMQPYPQTLLEQPELRPALVPGEPATPGASELRASLFTLPTHRFVDESDLARLERWLGRRGADRADARDREEEPSTPGRDLSRRGA